VDVGDMKISTPGAALASRHLASMQSEGYIEVPGNTIGPGEPLWVTRSLQNASVRLASAEADWLEAEVARTYRRNVHDRYGYGYFFYVLYAFEPWQTTRLAGYEPASPAAACGAHPTHPDTSHTKSSPAGDHVAPAVTVHKDTPATTMHDRRVDVGDMKISTPGPVTASGHPGTARLDRSVEVPINTIGAGVPLWVTRGLQDAEQRIAEAQAAWVEADAKRYYLR
jgi:hypothetical protein